MGEHGQGGITKRPDGRLQVSLMMPSGRRGVRYVPASLVRRDPRKAQRLAESLRVELVRLREADLDPSSQTVGDYLRSWLATLPNRKLRPRTVEHYTLVVERHIIPALGGYRLDGLRERHVQTWLDADPVAPRTRHHHKAVLRRALNTAVRQRLVDRNVATVAELGDVPEFRGSPLTLVEVRRLFEATSEDRLHALWRLAVDTGLRESELLGLAWADVDGSTVTVRAQLSRVGGGWALVPPKAGRKVETVAIGSTTAAALRKHSQRVDDSWPYHGLVFVTEKGMPYHRRELLREWHGACDKAGIARRRFHDLRATSAHLLDELGVPEHVRMARLGHVTTKMARHYAGASVALDREAAARLDTAVNDVKSVVKSGGEGGI
jgi:integrase